MALAVTGNCLRRLAFGHATAEAAAKDILAAGGRPPAVDDEGNGRGRPRDPWQRDLVERLQTYAGGALVDFCDIKLEWETAGTSDSDFRRKVWAACRRIAYGQTASYAQLATCAGQPNAARAVGNCMAKNPMPLIVPCHRVVAAGGKLGNYSAIGGISTKRRLLEMEASCFSGAPLQLS
jgi:O-6-methylguanine DNA methyltransferase